MIIDESDGECRQGARRALPALRRDQSQET